MVAPTAHAVLGPTNTGKTHLAIERMCAHSSGAIGFPLRLLAREVYDRVCKLKPPGEVALITGEERIVPEKARYFLCTAEALPTRAEWAFFALDEAQLGADRERGHVFTKHLLDTRGREETLILGAETLAPMVKALLPGTEITRRPRFSTLAHAPAKKVSRLPKRTALVAFSAEEVYAAAEMLRRLRGGAAVVTGALSPRTRNAQVDLFQSGEVDYLVATDAIGMGLNLDLDHVAFAGLAKFDGVRRRRLTTAEMSQIAGRAGRHQRDGTFGTIAGTGKRELEFEPEEVAAIEDHRFPPLSGIFWREPDPRYDNLATLIDDLEAPPNERGLMKPPEAIDLAVLKKLAEDDAIAGQIAGTRQVERFWHACSLPDFRNYGVDNHARFVARLWQQLRGGKISASRAAQAIDELNRTGGDIDTLQQRIAAIRSWTYIAERPDWVEQRDALSARAREVEDRLSDALHERLTERFVNRRTSLLMKKLGEDGSSLPVTVADDVVLVDEERLGRLEGFTFRADADASAEDSRMLHAAAEKHLPRLLGDKALALAERIAAAPATVTMSDGRLLVDDRPLAQVDVQQDLLKPRLQPHRNLTLVPDEAKAALLGALEGWLGARMEPLAPLEKLAAAAKEFEAGSELRALLVALSERGGMIPRVSSGLDALDPEQRKMLSRLGVTVGALDIFHPGMLKRKALAVWRDLAITAGRRLPPLADEMQPVLEATRPVPLGYRGFGKQALRLDSAEKILREAHKTRVEAKDKQFILDPSLAISTGMTPDTIVQLMRAGGFKAKDVKALGEGAFGPPAQPRWRWQPRRGGTHAHAAQGKPGGNGGPRRGKTSGKPSGPVPGNPFAELGKLLP
jgi:ATP-dependent RNA helicase SUPV3L1/SUV3